MPSTAAAQELPEILTVDKIHRGQTGYGLTVFQGFKIERFKVKVLDVLHNFLPKQDIILMKVDHPRLRKTNVVGGMSGSPIYLGGKLVGALAYGWRFSKEPITGITPISAMLKLLKRKLRGPMRVASAGPRARRRVDRLALASFRHRDRWWRPTLPFRRISKATREAMLQPVSVPLNIAGFSPEAVVDLRRAFSPYGFDPVQGGGTGKAEGPKTFTPGGAIGIRMVAGDLSMAGTGTVTAVKGNNVLAFGHSAFNGGEIYMPVVSARIAHTLASVSRSFKLSSPARTLGALVQDRQAAIHADTSRRVSMIPVNVTLRNKTDTRVFHATIARHRLLIASLARMVLSSALTQALADVDPVTYRMETRIAIKNHPPITLVEHRYSAMGARRSAAYFNRGLFAIRALLSNPFEPVEIERVDTTIDVKYRDFPLAIRGLQVSNPTVAPGARINLAVRLKAYGKREFTKPYPLEIPRSLAGSVILVEAASGSRVRPTLARPKNLRQYIRYVQTQYSGRSLVLSIYLPAEGLKVAGEVLRDLPPSVADTLITGSKVRSERAFKEIRRRVLGTRSVITGRKQIRIRVKSEVE